MCLGWGPGLRWIRKRRIMEPRHLNQPPLDPQTSPQQILIAMTH